MSSRARVDSAADAFERFTGHVANHTQRVDIGSDALWRMGKVEYIGYSTTRDGKREKYVHEFEKSRPTLAVTHDGKTALILGGGFRVTERGFEDREE